MELSLDTLEDLLLEGEIKQVKDDSLVLSEEFTTKGKKKGKFLVKKMEDTEKSENRTYEAIL